MQRLIITYLMYTALVNHPQHSLNQMPHKPADNTLYFKNTTDHDVTVYIKARMQETYNSHDVGSIDVYANKNIPSNAIITVYAHEFMCENGRPLSVLLSDVKTINLEVIELSINGNKPCACYCANYFELKEKSGEIIINQCHMS